MHFVMNGWIWFCSSATLTTQSLKSRGCVIGLLPSMEFVVRILSIENQFTRGAEEIKSV